MASAFRNYWKKTRRNPRNNRSLISSFDVQRNGGVNVVAALVGRRMENDALRKYIKEHQREELQKKSPKDDAKIEKIRREARANELLFSSTRVELQSAKQAVKDRDARIIDLESEAKKRKMTIYGFEKSERNLISQIESLKYRKKESPPVEAGVQKNATFKSNTKSFEMAALEKKLEDKQSLLDQLQKERGLFASEGDVHIVLSEWVAWIIIGCMGVFFVVILVIWCQRRCSKRTKPKNSAEQFLKAQTEAASKAANVSQRL